MGAQTARPFPALLSETGWLDPVVRPFSPQYPLWSDGATKRRWVHVPEGTTIDVSEPDHWDFPDGTRFWKEFSFGGRRVETRMLWKVAGQWQFAAYAWNDDQTDAVLASERGLNTAAEVAPGRRHRVPSVTECRACHDSTRTEILGFGALQLSDDRDPLAPHAEPVAGDMLTLGTLVREERLRPAQPGWRNSPPRIIASDPQTRAVLGYLSANCGNCHNPKSEIANLALDFQARTADAGPCPTGLLTTLGRPSKWEIPGARLGHSRRLTPGLADLSTLVVRMRSRRASEQMPPLGSSLADHTAIALLTAWVGADDVTWAARQSGC
jgi:hypothetical protein